MGLIDVRRFLVQTWLDDGVLKAGEPELAKEDTWDVNLAEVIRVNALAVPADRKITLSVMQHELRILTSFLTDPPGGPIIMRQPDFKASAGHIKRFLSESLGLGMLTAAVERLHRWELDADNLDHFDVLPAKWEGDYEKTGTRPDLLFDFASQGEERRLAGEARGRSEKRPRKKSNKDQCDRLDQIVAWSGRNELHPVTMTYTYTGAERVQVDLFDIVAPEKGELPEVDLLDETHLPVTAQGFVESPHILRQQAIGRVTQIADALYETAPPNARVPQRTIFGRNVRGNWTTADLLGPTGIRFFLGVLDEPLDAEQTADARRRRKTRISPDADPIRVAASGRLLVAVARDYPANPDWSEVRDRVE